MISNFIKPYQCASLPLEIRMGNRDIIKEVEKITWACIKNKTILYDAQDNIKQYLCNKYGESWYRKNEEATQRLVEEEYCHAYRRSFL